MNCSGLDTLQHVAVDCANGNVYAMSFGDGTTTNIQGFTQGSTAGQGNIAISSGEQGSWDFTVYDNVLYLAEQTKNDTEKTATITLKRYWITLNEGSLTATQIGDLVQFYTAQIPEYETFKVNDMIVHEGSLYVIAGGVMYQETTLFGGKAFVLFENGTGVQTTYTGASRGMLFKIDPATLSVQKTVGRKESSFKIRAKYGYPTGTGGKNYVTYENDLVKYGTDNHYAKIYANSSLSDASAFVNPVKFAAVKPGKLLIADDGIIFYTQNDVDFYEDANRIVTVDLETFAMAAETTASHLEKDYEKYDNTLYRNSGYATTSATGLKYRKGSELITIQQTGRTTSEGIVLWPKKLWDNDP